MTIELTMLFYSTILYFVLIMIPAGYAIKENGPKAQAGPRDNLPEPSEFLARGRRLAANMQENMVLFAALVLTAHVAGVSTDYSVLGAQIFFYARVVHAVAYLTAMKNGRPVIWLVSVIGMGMVGYPLI